MSERMTVLYNKKPCYDIVFAKDFSGLWEELAALECAGRRLCVVTDSRVDEHYGGGGEQDPGHGEGHLPFPD